MAGRFDDDDDDKGGGGGGGSALDRFRSKVASLEDGGDDDADGGDEEDGDDEPEPRSSFNERGEEEPEITLTRAQKKKERLGLRDELERQRTENRQLAERLARLEGAQSSMERRDDVRDATDENDDDDGVDERLDELQNKLEGAWNELQLKRQRNAATQADVDAYKKLAKDIDKQKARVVADGIVSKRMREVEAQMQQQAATAQIRQQYADVYQNKNAVLYANGEHQRLIALGKPDDATTLHAAMTEARRAFRLGQSQPPSEAQRARFAGPPRGRGSVADREPETIKMTAPLRRLADAAYSHIPDPQKRYETWARSKAGREYAKSSKRGGE